MFVPGGSLQVVNILPVSPNWQPSPLLDQSLSPQLSFISENFKNFLSMLTTFVALNCIRKLYFMLKTPEFALILLGGGAFWA